ncbi:crossover junction endonuclease MUS81-like isoform X2 [Triticum dicoccoides]|uniref:crossover junction endonuclease MUS81-like isoform X2 n=1 Tax=Triticum dicoccoides TaxID=85692 RepID=UPI00189036DD|nr:crossover junction endonuclease MUS81-like isoform X2 [Triticum dicoccoides]
MAPSVPKKKRKVSLPENEEVAARIFEKHRSMAAQQPAGLPDHQARALAAAYIGVCSAKEPVRTPGDLARLKGVGGWVVDVMKDSFPGSSLDSSPPRSNTPGETGKKRKRNKPYVPQLNSAAYAIVITLYREMIRGTEVMKKQELIDAAEASGLSRKAIGPNNYKSKHGNSGSDFYTGWSCMKNLTDKDLVVKKSNPAKYYLTEKGKETARICLANSGLDDPAGPLIAPGHPESVMLSDSDSDEQEGSSPPIGSENFSGRGGLPNSKADNGRATNSPLSSRGMSGQQSFSAMGSAETLLAMPPHRYDENFLDTYEVVLILDDRDTFGARARRKVVDNIHTQFDVPVEIKHLPVGDALWVARHKELGMEYVLDFIVERKNVDDLLGSIKDNRYKDQKLRLKKCGLRKLIYLVEGDVNTVDGSESVKTACFTTEVLEGFDVQRTNGYADTEKKYGHLTRSIIDYYRTNFSAGADTSRLCLTYGEFVKRCSDLEKVTVSDIFALQLMQVPQVTEEGALAVTSLYPTLLSLARAYSMLDGDRRAQEEMLKNKSDMVNTGASKNIFKLIWAEG